ncbi:type III pantothenate kinase [Candidatus Kinetoplastibacterium desouzaii TCC079E]|uniref:Type III pantothenate kinase n=1 Tax=Candidatus Kinetoplastidibacterium desouzai TCC079E TaxID=1208919 RepID=M1M504_9PROT|nr:type III pantothenate kinase [Candidatus Kinetoplastibacterium desouzaii]AGF47240.1 type III pantothenate kinase [Candidatus Kinetoplastibacterium desouzaii TCC079E]
MIILIDSGNSRIKIGWLDYKMNVARRESHAAIFDNLNIKSLSQWISTLPKTPIYAIGSNVAGKQREAIITNELHKVGCDVNWISSTKEMFGLTNNYQSPYMLGTDRWASMIGILSRQTIDHPPFIVASFGTATTIDTVSPDNIFMNGIILPGTFMMRQALTNGTANLPMTNGNSTRFSTDTIKAINSGVAAAQSGALMKQYTEAFHIYKQIPNIYVTGGVWPELETEIRNLLGKTNLDNRKKIEISYIDRPVLDGLARIAELYYRNN